MDHIFIRKSFRVILFIAPIILYEKFLESNFTAGSPFKFWSLIVIELTSLQLVKFRSVNGLRKFNFLTIDGLSYFLLSDSALNCNITNVELNIS